MISIDLDTIVKKIETQWNSFVNRSKAIFHATQVSNYEMAGDRFSKLLNNHTKMHKLEPWLKRARLNYTNN